MSPTFTNASRKTISQRSRTQLDLDLRSPPSAGDGGNNTKWDVKTDRETETKTDGDGKVIGRVRKL